MAKKNRQVNENVEEDMKNHGKFGVFENPFANAPHNKNAENVESGIKKVEVGGGGSWNPEPANTGNEKVLTLGKDVFWAEETDTEPLTPQFSSEYELKEENKSLLLKINELGEKNEQLSNVIADLQSQVDSIPAKVDAKESEIINRYHNLAEENSKLQNLINNSEAEKQKLLSLLNSNDNKVNEAAIRAELQKQLTIHSFADFLYKLQNMHFLQLKYGKEAELAAMRAEYNKTYDLKLQKNIAFTLMIIEQLDNLHNIQDYMNRELLKLQQG